MTISDRPVLITGGAGFIGVNLADQLAQAGHKVLIYDALKRPGVNADLAWLQDRHASHIVPIIADICDEPQIGRAVSEASVVFHLAAQVAVTSSLAAPDDDFRTNLQGTFSLLEAVRRTDRHLPLIFASTNKVYGNLSDVALALDGERYVPQAANVRTNGIDENRSLKFSYAVRLLQRRGGSVCFGLCAQLWNSDHSIPHELHLWTTSDRYGRPGLDRAFSDPGTKEQTNHDLWRWPAGT